MGDKAKSQVQVGGIWAEEACQWVKICFLSTTTHVPDTKNESRGEHGLPICVLFDLVADHGEQLGWLALDLAVDLLWVSVLFFFVFSTHVELDVLVLG